MGDGQFFGPALAHEAECGNGLRIQQQVLRHRQVANLGHLLEGGLQPVALRDARAVESSKLAANANLPRIRLHEAA